MTTIPSELAQRVSAALTADSRTKGSTIKVVEHNGVLHVINELAVRPVDLSAISPQPVPPEDHPHIEA